MSDSHEAPLSKAHHLLGPRTAYLIGSERSDGSSHLCAASNVTNVGIDPQVIALGLWPEWETTRNILRTGEATVNLMDASHIDDIWIVGAKYSKVELLATDDKYVVGGFTQNPSTHVHPACVAESIASLECQVLRSLDDVSDHIIFLVKVVAAHCDRGLFDSDYIIDVHRAHPIMQISSRYFAQCEPAPTPDTDWCSQLALTRRSADTA